jgi:cysteine desulfurase
VRETLHDLARLFSLPLTELRVDGQARLSPESIAEHSVEEGVLLALLAANNEVGSLNDVKALCEACDAKGNIFRHVDAVQALGKIPIDVRRWNCDSAAFASHKVYGPKGVGFLFLRAGRPLDPISTGGGQEARLRGGTENVAGIVGMAAAVRLSVAELEAESTRLARLRDLLWELLKMNVPSACRNTPMADALPNTLNVSFPGWDGRALVRELDERGFAVSAASACSSSGTAISHVLRAMTSDELRQRGAVRFSLGRSSTEGAVRGLASAVAALAAGAGSLSPLR